MRSILAGWAVVFLWYCLNPPWQGVVSEDLLIIIALTLIKGTPIGLGLALVSWLLARPDG